MSENKVKNGPESPPCLQVALPLPIAGTFDYLPPEGLAITAVPTGSRVEVPFGNRRMMGVVTGHGPCTLPDPARLRPAIARPESQPVVPAALIDLMCWASRYYQHPLGEVIFSLLPPAMRKRQPLRAGMQKHWQAVPEGKPADRARRQLALWSWLLDHGPGSLADIRAAGFSRELLRALTGANGAEAVDMPEDQPAPQAGNRFATQHLTASQQAAVNEFPVDTNAYVAGLLHGVTGSGKTEVYLQLIGQALQAGRQAILLVPEISLTPQTLQRVTNAFGTNQVAIMHSGVGAAERLRAWLDLRDGRRSVLVGARSAVLTPMQHPGLVIVDEEHDASYKQQDGFRYSARDLAVKRAQQEGIPVLLGSATPSLESLHNARQGRYRLLSLPQRIHGRAPPAIELLDIRRQELTGGIARPLANRIHQHLAAQGQVLIFQNRRGYAPVLLCDSCGHSFECAGCDRPLTVHLSQNMLCCHHCGKTQPLPRHCPACRFSELTMLGAGTQRISAHLQDLFPEVPIVRVDRDSVRSQRQHQAVYEKIRAGDPAILVGTQMLAKGHDFPGLTLVGVLDVDGGLLSSDFRGLERTAQLVTQVAGRAGRADRAGEVILQTRRPEHPALQILVQRGYLTLAEHLLAERERAALPPFAALASVSAESKHADDAAQALEQLQANLRDQLPAAGGIELWGPVPAPMPRRAGRHRQQMMVWSERRALLQQVLPTLRKQMDALPPRRDLRIHLDVDPLDLN